MSCGKIAWLPSMSRSQQRLIQSTYDHFYYVVRAADPFATKHSLTVRHHKLEHIVKGLDCGVQVQGHVDGLKLC